jgi:hypothetical protein
MTRTKIDTELDNLLEQETEKPVAKADRSLEQAHILEETPPKTEWEQVVDRLNIACGQNIVWLGIPSAKPVQTAMGAYYPEETKEIKNCTGEEFMRWLLKYMPFTKEYNHVASDYDKEENRRTVVLIVEETYKRYYEHPIKISEKL